MDTSDIVQGKRAYIYSHAEEIIVCDHIWLRHIWIRQDPPNHWLSSVDENRLMDFEPTNRPASQYTGKRTERPRRVKPKRPQVKSQPNPRRKKSKAKLEPTPHEAKPEPPVQEPEPVQPKQPRKPKPKLHPSPKSIRDFIRKFGE